MGDRLRKSEWCVHPVSLDVCQEMVKQYHYARGGSNTGTYCHGLFRVGADCQCYGIAWWLPPTKGAAIASWNGDWQRVLSLSRLVIVPDVPKNAATFLLSRSVKFIARDGRCQCLVTYADTWQGHTGGIYRAAGWEYLGLSGGEECWVDVAGRMVSRKAGPKTRTRTEMLALGYRSAGRHPKHKFRKILPVKKVTLSPTLFG